jgi:hypothetical protein
MNSITRLIWKEYRVQRTLWLALFIGWLVIFSLARWYSAEAYQGPLSLRLASILCTAVCFGAAAICIAFAGEVEERTAGGLRMMPCSTSQLMTGKLIAIAAGMLSLIATMQLYGVLADLFLDGLHYWLPSIRPWHRSSGSSSPTDALDRSYLAANFLLLLACSLAASLRSARILSAVGKTAVAAVLMGILMSAVSYVLFEGMNVGRGNEGVPIGVNAAGGLLLLAGSVLFLSRPWHLGRISEQNSVRDRWLQAFESTVPAGATGLSLSRRFWINGLKWIAWRQESSRRIESTLVWRELRSIVPFAAVWLPLGMLVCLGRCFVSIPYFFNFLFLMVLILECGLRTMREDQRTQNHLLLVNLGISARQMWRVKTLCWLMVAVVLGGIIVAGDQLLPSWGMQPYLKENFRTPAQSQVAEARILSLIDVMRAPDFAYQPFSMPSAPATIADRWIQVGVCLAGGLWLFAVGHLMACWIRRQFLAFGGSLIVGFGGITFLQQLIARDWSVWLSAVPIPICLLAAVGLTSTAWLSGRVSRSLRIQQTAWLLCPLIVFPLIGHSHWKHASDRLIQQVESEIQHFAGKRPDDAVQTLTFHSIEPNAMLFSLAQDSVGNQRWYDSARYSRPISSSLHGISTGEYPLESKYILPAFLGRESSDSTPPDAYVEEVLKPFRESIASGGTLSPLPIEWTSPWSETPAPHVVSCLLADAQKKAAAGQIKEAANQLVTAVSVSRQLAGQTSSWANWLSCLDAERVVLSRLRALLATADLSTVDLLSVYKDLKREVFLNPNSSDVIFPDPRPMLARRTWFAQVAVSVVQNPSYFQQMSEQQQLHRTFQNINNGPDQFGMELLNLGSAGVSRAAGAMQLSEWLVRRKIENLSIGGRMSFMAETDRQWQAYGLSVERELSRLLATTSLGDTTIDLSVMQPVDSNNPVLHMLVDTVAAERATLLSILLHQHRLTHGQFPALLSELRALDDHAFAALITDPWTGSQFTWFPQGIPQISRPAFAASLSPFKFDQPILMTVGSPANHQPSTVRTASEVSDVLNLPNRFVPFLGTQDRFDGPASPNP